MAVQSGLYQTRSETPKTGFLVTQLILFLQHYAQMSDSDFVDVEGVDSAVDYSNMKRARQVG